MEMNGTTMEELRTMESIQSINHKIPELTLRDLFAMNALNGLVVGDWGNQDTEGMANLAYMLANAMLKARSEK